MNINTRRFCVAPMMGFTTPYARKLYRILSKRAFLFTEMVPSKTMLYSKTRDLIIENSDESSVALQVGGAEPHELAKCARIAKNYNYDEINLNVGCPSKAVKKGGFGVCLMNEKVLVRNCLEAMIESTDIEVSIKCRIGIGKEFNYDFFCDFINEVIKSGVNIVYVHARNAILNGLTTKNNRTVPPLNYDFVTRIKKEYPYIQFILNGGIDSIEKAFPLSKIYDGVMIGRLIQNNPFSLTNVDHLFYKTTTETKTSERVILEYFQYIKKRLHRDSMFRLLSPLLHIFFGLPNNKKFKTEICSVMKSKKIDALKSLFLQFIDEKQVNCNFYIN
jgi:tRNA-dihydrouridine synthase A